MLRREGAEDLADLGYVLRPVRELAAHVGAARYGPRLEAHCGRRVLGLELHAGPVLAVQHGAVELPALEARQARFQTVEGFGGALGTVRGHDVHHGDWVTRDEHTHPPPTSPRGCP